MKVIHVAGWSGSGKTTFIVDLIRALSAYGSVGTVKHIGDHIIDQESGKDTTRHYEMGAVITAGIDLEKTLITSRSTSLSAALDMLCNAGVRYAIVEGFKKVRFQKVVFGDIDTPALARNPCVSDLISLLPHFDEYYTLEGLIAELDSDEPEGVFACVKGIIPFPDDEKAVRQEADLSRMDGILGARVRVNPMVFTPHPEYFIVIKGKEHTSVLNALSNCIWPLSPEKNL